MIKVMTSYFYQVRFMEPHMIPLSTCLSDPKWFHQGTYNKQVQFQDKNGVWNGLRAEPFVPGPSCNKYCSGQPCPHKPDSCNFLKYYYKQLQQLNFNNIIWRFQTLGYMINNETPFKQEPIYILLVHEAYDNLCSERWMIHKWFQENGYNIQEFKH